MRVTGFNESSAIYPSMPTHTLSPTLTRTLPDEWHQYKTTRSLKLRNKLIAANDGLARKVAHRWAGLCNVPYDDLAQVARIGLVKGVERFDPDSGNAFSSFAVPYIKGEILHFLRDYNPDLVKIPRQAREQRAEIKAERKRCINKYGMQVSERDIAIALGYSEAEWAWIQDATDRRAILCLEDCEEWLQADEPQPEARDWSHALYRAMAYLPSEDYQLIWRNVVEERTPKQLAIALRQDEAAIVQRLEAIKAKLASLLQPCQQISA